MNRITILVLIYSLSGVSNGQENLCALSKKDGKCVCDYYTNNVNHIPELAADCKWVGIERFPDAKDFPDDLSILNLAHNEIGNLDTTTDTVWLTTLNLAYNNIEEIDNRFFDKFPNLVKLTLSHNKINKLHPESFSRLTKLRHLDLSFNKLTDLPDNIFAQLENLEELNLGYNDIGKFLETYKSIFESSVALPKNLSYLNLDRVGLDAVPTSYFDGGDNLKKLTIADNYFDEIPTIPYSVEYFDFSGNNITELNVRHLNYHSLRVLKLNRIPTLETIENYAFYNMQNLEELHLDNCPRLKELNSLAFGVLRPYEKLSLKKLSASRSGLKRINETYMYLLKDLKYIDLQNNPWHCDCHILWVKLLDGMFEKQDNMRCLTPLNIRNVKIMDLEEKHLPNCLMSTKHIKLQKILIPILGVAVILLLCLIVYLLYMGPYLYRNYRNVGPDSPYQHTVLREYNN